jgi:hypothetical protein
MCLLIALFGTIRKFGLWIYFFAAVALAPPLDLIMVLATAIT